MLELLQAPTEGYGDAIVIPDILAENFELKVGLLTLVTSSQFHGFERYDPHSHIRWFNKITSTLKYKNVPREAIKLMLFLFSLEGAAQIWLKKEPHTTNLKNDIMNFQQRFDETFSEAWDRLKDLLQITALTDVVKDMLLQNKTHSPASVKAIKETYVTCGGLHPYYECLVTDGNTFNASAATGTYNQGGSLPSNTIPNSRGEIKAIITRSGIALDGPSVHLLLLFLLLMRLNKEKLQDKSDIQVHKFLQIFKKLHFTISLAKALALMPKYHKMLKDLLFDKKKLLGLANTSLTENCSAVLLKQLPEKLGDPGRFLIPCDFHRLESCVALADLGASINLIPLSVWKKLSLLIKNSFFTWSYLLLETLLSFSSENEDKVFNPGILTSKGVHSLTLIAPDYEDSRAFGFVHRSLKLLIYENLISYILLTNRQMEGKSDGGSKKTPAKNPDAPVTKGELGNEIKKNMSKHLPTILAQSQENFRKAAEARKAVEEAEKKKKVNEEAERKRKEMEDKRAVEEQERKIKAKQDRKNAEDVKRLRIKQAERRRNAKAQRDGCSYKAFLNCNPAKFHGDSDPVTITNWLKEIEYIFEICECSTRQRVKYASYLLKGEARHWGPVQQARPSNFQEAVELALMVEKENIHQLEEEGDNKRKRERESCDDDMKKNKISDEKTKNASEYKPYPQEKTGYSGNRVEYKDTQPQKTMGRVFQLTTVKTQDTSY
nr:reverse transcriptase domain-containing protein [Tanacetum cinerariifolium]